MNWIVEEQGVMCSVLRLRKNNGKLKVQGGECDGH